MNKCFIVPYHSIISVNEIEIIGCASVFTNFADFLNSKIDHSKFGSDALNGKLLGPGLLMISIGDTFSLFLVTAGRSYPA